jgi:hypothetical protein
MQRHPEGILDQPRVEARTAQPHGIPYADGRGIHRDGAGYVVAILQQELLRRENLPSSGSQYRHRFLLR